MLLALRKPVASPVQDNVVTVSFSSGPNLVSYDYTVACYAQDPAVPTTDCGAVDAEGTAPVVTPVTGTLPRGYAEVIVPVTLTGNEAVDCLVTVSSGPIDAAAKCQYAEAADAPPTPTPTPTALFVPSNGADQVYSCFVEGTTLTQCADSGMGTGVVNNPSGIAVNQAAQTLYATSSGTPPYVVVCTIDADGKTLSDCATAAAGGPITGNSGIVVKDATTLFVLNGDSVASCAIDGAGTSDPRLVGIVLNPVLNSTDMHSYALRRSLSLCDARRSFAS